MEGMLENDGSALQDPISIKRRLESLPLETPRPLHSESRWLSLPEDVLLRVLAHLNAQQLMTARLVCRQWRVACLATRKSVKQSKWPDFQGASLRQQRTMLESRLQLLTGLTAINLEISKLGDVALFNVPGCSAILRGVDFNRVILQDIGQHGPTSRPRRVNALQAPDATPLARLTGLTRFQAGSPSLDYARPAPPQPRFLDFGSQILQQCTQLREVNLACDASEWMQLLPHLAGLPHLRDLDKVPIGEDAVLERAAALTQLTALSFAGDDIPESLMRLTAMTSLKALILDSAPVHALSQAASGLTQLEILVLPRGHQVPVGDIEALLTPLRSLMQLQMWRKDEDLQVIPQRLFQGSLTRLKVLAWTVSTMRGASWHLSRHLRHLAISIPKRDGQKLFEEVAALKGLVTLTLAVLKPPKRWSTATRHNKAWRAGTFLSGMTGLTSLNLRHILHARNMEEDVRCIATLTNLENLVLHGKCACHDMRGDFDSADDWLIAALSGVPEDNSNQGNCPISVGDFECKGGFLSLVSLRSLNNLWCSGPWCVIDESAFPRALDAVKHEMGRPPLKVRLGIY